jgi:tetratricopeptide (TPR) repeat protein
MHHSLGRSVGVLILMAGVAAAQVKGGGTTTNPGTGGPTVPGTGTIGAPTRNTIPSTNNPNTSTNPFPDTSRPVFLSGKVLLSDGTAPPEPVTIERVCGSRVYKEAWTDSKGRFSFQVGENRSAMMDASIDNGVPSSAGGMNNTRGLGSGPSTSKMFGCELRAALPGFRSESLNLSNRQTMDNPDVGTIYLKRMANVDGLTISATSYNAPKDARKAYEKGKELLKKDKFDEAAKQFEKSVEIYPKYAMAFYEIGRLKEGENKPEEARQAYDEALKADSKLIPPYERMAAMAIQEKKWQDAADISDRMIRLNPVDFPSAYFFNSLANLNMKKLDEAEKSAAELLKIDTQHRIARGEHLMAVVLAQKGEFEKAAPHFRAFIALVPAGSTDADLAKKQLADVEKTLAANKQE